MITALLIDDEEKNLDNLSFLLENDCDDIKVIGKVQSAAEAREWLSQNKVDVIFLDITMPLENAFQFLESVAVKNFQIIFVNMYAGFSNVKFDPLQRLIVEYCKWRLTIFAIKYLSQNIIKPAHNAH